MFVVNLKTDLMKFKISTVGFSYPNEEDRERLGKLGFSFNPSESEGFVIVRGEIEIEVNSLEEFVNLSKEHGDIILREDGSLKIYDDYLE